MSYLNPLRLHFSGRFQANPSTVNNDILHYDNTRFKPEYQDLGKGTAKGWWNPQGDAAFRLMGCRVTSAWHADGSSTTNSDPILHCLIADSDCKTTAKIVDLDPYQQMVSGIWGLQVRICGLTGQTLLRGDFEPASFMDIWSRAPGNDPTVGSVMYQSVLRKLEWGETRGSPFLQALKAASRDSGILSIKFNLDGYNMTNGDPEFSRGRMVGTIGPASSDEPVCFVAGRQFMPTAAQTQINSCVAKVDPTRSKIYLDLGNALPTVASGGTLSDLGVLSLGWIDDSTDPATTKPIDDIPYLNPNWYEQTAGVIELPANRSLTAAELAGIQQNQLVLLLTSPGGQPTPAISESPNGVYVRADQFVFRLNPGESATVTLIATQFGQRYSGARIISMLDSSQVLPFSPLSKKDASMPLPPPSASPIDAVEFPCRVMADKNGVAKLKIRAHAPGNPRGYIDGQVYGVRPVLEETIFMAGGPYPFNPGNIISVLIWDGFKPDNPPTWHGSIQPIFQQYANLYPVMGRFLNMADYEAVCANRRLMLLAFGLDPIDPNSMPVTRDLSGDKRKAILRWLTQVGRDGRPRKGTPRKAAKLSARKTALQMANGPSAVPQTRQFKYRPNPKNKPSRH